MICIETAVQLTGRLTALNRDVGGPRLVLLAGKQGALPDHCGVRA